MGYVLASVARAHGQLVQVIVREPYDQTLYAFLQLRDAERLAAIEARFERLRHGEVLARAFHEPERLGDVHRELMEELAAESVTPEDALARAQETIEAMQRIDQRSDQGSDQGSDTTKRDEASHE